MAREYVMVSGFSERLGPLVIVRQQGDKFLSGDFDWDFEAISPQACISN